LLIKIIGIVVTLPFFLIRACIARCISQYILALLSARAHPLIYSVDGIDFIGLYGINGATRTMGRRDVKTRRSIRANDRPSRQTYCTS